jgi:hypothetical protein
MLRRWSGSTLTRIRAASERRLFHQDAISI